MTDTATPPSPSSSNTRPVHAPVDDRVHRRRWVTLAVLCVSLLVIVIDNTIVNVALPTLVRDLGASISELQWIVDAYTLVFAGLLLTAGSLGDRFGRKGALTVGLVDLRRSRRPRPRSPAASTQLIAARAVMGIGAALIMPATLSILTNVFTDARERALAIGICGRASPASRVALGPVTGGFLLEHFWWGSVFLVNVPIVIARDRRRPRSSCRRRATRTRAAARPGRRAAVDRRPRSRWCAAIIEAPSNGWTEPPILGRLRGRRRRARRLRVVGAPHRRTRCSTSASSRTRASPPRASPSRSCSSPVRLHLPRHAVPAVRARLPPFEAGVRTLPFAVALMVDGAAVVEARRSGSARSASSSPGCCCSRRASWSRRRRRSTSGYGRDRWSRWC